MTVSKTEQTKHWASIQEAGTLFGLKLLWGVHRVFGRRAVSILLYPTVLYFLIFRPMSRSSSLEYLIFHAKAYPSVWKKTPTLLNTARHFKEFAETVVDKLLAWYVHIDVENFDVHNPEVIDELMKDQRGQLIIGTHMGNLEYCRGFMQRYRDKVINILIYDKHSANFATIMQSLNPDSRLNIFQVDDFEIDTMLKLKSKIDLGEWVFIAGDRIPITGIARTVDVQFLNQNAPLPIGPYMLAKALSCPVKLMFAYRDYSVSHERVFFEVVPFAEKVEFSRKNRMLEIQQYAQQFATEMEKHCVKVPYQWFNFFPFWNQAEIPEKGQLESTK